MGIDKSTQKPGPMGWGTMLFTEQERIDKEKRQHDNLRDTLPAQCIRQPAKSVINQQLLDKLYKFQGTDGIEEGFSFLHLEVLIFNKLLDWYAQIIGSCVASGGFYADVGRILAEVFILSETEETFGLDLHGKQSIAPFAPYNYRAGRDFGGLNGNQDGSFCAPHIEGKMKKGYLLCNHPDLSYSGRDLPEPQSASEYRKWGANNRLMDQFAGDVTSFLKESEKVTSGQDTIELQTKHFKPFQICSNYGFAPGGGNVRGFTFLGKQIVQYRRQGQWAHNMTVYGTVKVGGNWWVIIRNSWGNDAHENGCFFVVSLEDFDRWLRDAVCMSIGNIDLPDTGDIFTW